MSELELRDGSKVDDPRLGRLVYFDERSRDYPLEAKLTADEQKPRSYTWRVPVCLDQGSLGACVAFSWHHELAAKPVMCPVTNSLARTRYCEMQAIDYWPGESSACPGPGPKYEGTAIISGAKVLVKHGYMDSYAWAFSMEEMILAIGYKGPVVIGIPWYQGMFRPTKDGYVIPTGGVAGGHAICVNRVDITQRFFGFKNTWSSGWGVKDAWGLGGSARIDFDNMERLLSENGECCVPIGRKLGGQ